MVVINPNQSIPSFSQRDWLNNECVAYDLHQDNSLVVFFFFCFVFFTINVSETISFHWLSRLAGYESGVS